MNIDFTGKRVIACGASRGIGRAIALGFAEAGADVSICARGAETLNATRAELARFGHRTHAATCDLADGAAIRRYVADAANELGGVDVLINNASAFAIADDEASWIASLQVDLLAIVHATEAALPFLREAKGAVVNTSSISALRPAGRNPPYGGIKAAVLNYTSTQAQKYARDGIRVNAVAPGAIEFPGGVWDRRKSENPTLYNAMLKSCPFGRMGHPQEVASVVLFLASPLAAWVTGHTVIVDGGQMLGA